MIRVLLVDDHTMLREGLKTLLEGGGDITVLGQASTAEMGLELALKTECDVVVADLTLPCRDGFWLLKELRQKKPGLRVLVLSMHTDDRTVLKALESGAYGYTPKSASFREIATAVRDVAEGRSYIHSHVAASVFRELRHRHTPDTPAAGGFLTPREREILTMATQGLNSQTIAARLSLSVSTVKSHLRGLYRKLEVTDRTQAVLVGIQRGLVDGSHLHGSR